MEKNHPNENFEYTYSCKRGSATSVIACNNLTTINDQLDQFENFLRACGFQFTGRIMIYEEE